MESQAYNQQPVDIGMEAMAVLKTVLLLEKPYAGTYVQRILTGNGSFGWKKAHHKKLETFGEMAEKSYSYVDDLINYLVKTDFLRIKQAEYGTVELTESGRSWMEDPVSLMTTRGELRKSWYQVQLIQALRVLRRETAEKKEKQPFEVFTNYTMDVLADKLPQTEEELKAIPGLEKLDGATRLMVLAEITRIVDKKEIDEETGLFRKAFSPSHQKVKSLVLEGMTFDEIVRARDLSRGTAVSYLENLHRSGEVDLVPWIEKTVDGKVLHKMVQFFSQVKGSGLKQAHEVLGIDYELLRLGRLYSNPSYVPVRQAS
ncbi:MAG: RQC domain-containing protein [Bacteroidia bacterium]